MQIIRFNTFETDNFFHLCSMKTYRKSREEYRTLGKGYYHFCTDGWKEGNIFNTIAQYAYGMVLIGLISLKYSIVIYDFTLMPNHIHIIMSGTGEAALEAFGYLKRKLNKMLEADGYRPLPEEYSFRLEPVKDKDQMRALILYIARNHYEKLFAVPGGWPWCSTYLHYSVLGSLLEGKKANNCLLYGDAGTGKSSSIKAIMNEYYDRGLRIIELYKHQFRDLQQVIAQIKNRNYRFIIYMDDLSFEEFETDYKYLKAVIEGGLERKPENVLIYATSNRRHLVREISSDKADRDEDLHTNDTVQEKLSLAFRFGCQIYYGKPSPAEFKNIVKVLADRYGITLPEEELLMEANKWELSHGGISGRTAVQFVDDLMTRKR